jgi:hypothetical protein
VSRYARAGAFNLLLCAFGTILSGLLVTQPAVAQQGCDYVEGISAFLISTDASEVDTWSETYICPEIAVYYDAYVEGYLYQNNTLVDSGYALATPYLNDAYGEMQYSYSGTYTFVLQSDHYVVAFFAFEEDGEEYYSNPDGFVESSGGEGGSGEDFGPGDGPVYIDVEYIYLGSTGVQMSTAAPTITLISPTSAILGSSGTITVTGDSLLDVFTGETTPAITGSGVTLNESSPGSDTAEQVVLSYSIAASASTGNQTLTLATRFGTSNGVAFAVDDPAPVITSVSPSTWPAGVAKYQVTIAGSYFGTNPSVTTNDPYVLINGTPSVSQGFSNGQLASSQTITLYVSVGVADPGGQYTLTVTSTGYGNGFAQAPPGGSLSATSQVAVSPYVPPAATILYFNGSIPATVYVGQLISLTTNASSISALPPTSYSWSFPASNTGTVIASWSGNSSSGETATSLSPTSLTSAAISFYWVSAGNSSPVTNSIQYAYCVNNSLAQCSSTSTASFSVAAPTSPTATTTTTGASIVNSSGGLLAFQTATGSAPGIKLVAQSSLPSGNNGSYQWVQLLNSDQTQFINAQGPRTCTTFTGPAGTPELDGTYPYGNGTGTVTTTSVTDDTAQDSPNSGLPSNYGELQRSFNATMYLRWAPSAGGSCTAGNACTIPIPLGSATWWWNGDAINTLVPQGNGTNWVLACGDCSQGQQNPNNVPPTITFQAAPAPGSSNNYSYLTWSNTVPLGGGCH